MGAYKVSVWYPLILIEVCILLSWILGYLLWYAKKESRRLQGQVTTLRKAQASPQTPSPVHPPIHPEIATTTILAAQESHHAEDTPSPIAQEIEDSSDTESQGTTCLILLSEAPPDTLADACSAHTRLTQELAAQQQRITALRTREKAKDLECQQLQDALTAATQELAQQKAAFSELHATHDDLSNEYQRLFDIFKK